MTSTTRRPTVATFDQCDSCGGTDEVTTTFTNNANGAEADLCAACVREIGRELDIIRARPEEIR